MKILKKFSTVLVLAIFAAGAASFAFIPTANAHKIYTAKGKYVYHGHYGKCGLGCPLPDEWYEKQVGFSAADRIYSGTNEWNAAGRTFDNRQSWVFSPEQFVKDDPAVPDLPLEGNVILFWKNQKINHSVSIVGPWQGLNTLIMSKYGTYGQYKHKLMNSIKFYGWNWLVVKFSNTPVYSGSKKPNRLVAGSVIPEQIQIDPAVLNKLFEAREKMSWYKDVLESKKIFESEHVKLVETSSKMADSARLNYLKAKTDDEKMAVLIKDFADDAHYAILGAYDQLEFAQDFLESMESGKLLVEMAKKKPELRQKIISALKNLTDERKKAAAEMILKRM